MWYPWDSPPRSTDYKMALKRLQEVNFKYFTSIRYLFVDERSLFSVYVALYLFCKNVGNKLYFQLDHSELF